MRLITRQIVTAAATIATIAMAMLFRLDTWLAALILLITITTSLIIRKSWYYRATILGAILLYTSISTDPTAKIPHSGNYLLSIEQRNRATIEGFRDESGWHTTRKRIYYNSGDSLLDLRSGDKVVANCSMSPLGDNLYAKLSPEAIHTIQHHPKIDIARSIREICIRRIDRLELTNESATMTKAMLLGQRDEISRERYRDYQRSGSAHILAVSGLHVAIVYLIIGQLLRLLHLFRSGFRLIPYLSIALIWLYAYIVELSPSIQRAAIIFTLYHLLRITGRGNITLGVVALAAAVMVLIEPYLLYDIGFLLSIVAVIAIIVWVQPLGGAIKCITTKVSRLHIIRGTVNFTLSALLIGGACTLATLPIVSATFGYIAPFGVLLNPLIIITTYLIIALTLVWILIGIPPIAYLLREVINNLVSLQDSAVSNVANSPLLGAYEFNMNIYSAMLSYAVLIIGTIALKEFLATRNSQAEKHFKHIDYTKAQGSSLSEDL